MQRNGRLSPPIVEAIANDVMDGQLKPGTELPALKELAARFEVGLSVARDAMTVLADRGIITIQSGRRARVARLENMPLTGEIDRLMTRHDRSFVELMEARLLIEAATAPLAAERASDSDLAAIRQALAPLSDRGIDLRQFACADMSFHDAVATAAGNRFLVELLQTVRQRVLRGVYASFPFPRAVPLTYREHQTVYQAIAARDPQGARAAMETHLSEAHRRYEVALGLNRQAASRATAAWLPGEGGE